MWNLFKNKKKQAIGSPVQGRLIDLSSVKDEAFASKAMGDGFAIEPSSDIFVSPIDGTIAAVFPTGHAFGITNDDMEIIIHIGIDTVELQGNGFHSYVNQGDQVKKGDPVVKADIASIKAKGYDVTTMVIFTDGKQPVVEKLNELVKEGEDVASIA